MELLSPGGSLQGVIAAVQNGADAVYLGYGDFNARRNAKNFTPEQVAQAVDYCHLRGVSVFLTLNTLLTQRELSPARDVVAHARDMGIDAVIVQDLGVAGMIAQIAPSLALHGSTQLTVHSLDGVKQLADLGFSRVVLSRELPRGELEYIATHSPLELETFVHGALCMCYSGQCYFSAMIGQRSGNRGLCAQPCRLEYQWQVPGGKPGKKGTPMSLKDLSLAGHLQELKEMGLACLKIEGRMKRPEYVAIVTKIYAKALKEGREPTPEEQNQLESAFSRQGFTQGYYQDAPDSAMFGVRENQPEPRELFAQAQATYQKENLAIPLWGECQVKAGQAGRLTLWDDLGNTATVEGDSPEPARNQPLTRERITDQLSRTGGTPFVLENLEVTLDDQLSLPVSALNHLRRQGLEEISRQRISARKPGYQEQQRETKPEPFALLGQRHQHPEPPCFTLQVSYPAQITPELLQNPWGRIHLPHHFASHPQVVEACLATGAPVSVVLPVITWDRERQNLQAECDTLAKLGVKEATVSTLDALHWAKSQGFALVGDYGLGAYNNHTLAQLTAWGLVTATPSFELKFPQIRDLDKTLPLELLAYGHLPLMTTQHNMLDHSKTTQGSTSALLIDRKQVGFPVDVVSGGRNQVRNSAPLYLADKKADWQAIGLWGARLLFTQENPERCQAIATAYHQGAEPESGTFTRGLYYRGVD